MSGVKRHSENFFPQGPDFKRELLYYAGAMAEKSLALVEITWISLGMGITNRCLSAKCKALWDT